MFLEGAIQSLYNSGKLEPPKLTVKPNGSEKPVVGDMVTGNTSGATAIVAAVNGNVLTLVSVLKVFTTADNAATMSNSGGTVAVVAYDPGTKVYPLLGFSHPADSRSDSITVQMLLDHQGGYNDGTNLDFPAAMDPTYNMRKIGQALGHVVAGKLDMAHYMYDQPLQFAPGTASAYSNFGYLLLGAVVEKVTGKTYHDYLLQSVCQPAGVTEVLVFPTRASGRTSQMAIAEDDGLGQDPLDLGSSAQHCRCLWRRRRDQRSRRSERRDRRLGARSGDFRPHPRGVGQRRPLPRRRSLGQYAWRLDLGRVALGRDRLGLYGQHPQLAADQRQGRGDDHERQADAEDDGLHADGRDWRRVWL